jgi:hypothetical protein
MRRHGLTTGAISLAAALLAAVTICAQVIAAPKVNLVQRTTITLKIRPLTATPKAEPVAGAFSLEVEQGGSEEVAFQLLWPDSGSTSSVRILASETVPSGDMTHAVEIQGELTLPGGRLVQSRQTLEFRNRTTALFELFSSGGQSLILAIEAETSIETVASLTPTVGEPLLFKLEIQRVEGKRAIPLETNLLHTFIGEAVSYSFRLGSSPESDSALISLEPTRLLGGIAEIDLEITGTLPGDDGPVVLGKRERWLASSGAVTSLSFTTGEPASGYRFLVTASF